MTRFLSCLSSGQIPLHAPACDQFPSVSIQTTSESVRPVHFSGSSQAPPAPTSLIPATLVNGRPVCTSPALPPLKLPAGCYRDAFRNAVYASLSTLALSIRYSPPPIFHTSAPLALPNPSSLSFFCLLSLGALSFVCPFDSFLPFSLCGNLIISSYNSVAGV